MKKLFLSLLVAGATLTFSCNPSDNSGSDKEDKKETSRKDKEEEEETEDVETKATAELCDCINSSLEGMNPKVRRIIVKAGNSDDPMQTLQSELMKITDKDEQQELSEQFQKFESDPELKNCSERIKKKYDLDDNDKKSQKKIMKAAEENEDCDVVYALMKIGMQQEALSGSSTSDDN